MDNITFRMAVAQCNACDRKHERPVNSKCSYMAAALGHCKSAGIELEKYRLYLPPVGDIAGQGVEQTVSTPSSPAFSFSPSDVKALLLDNEEARQQAAETQRQLAEVIKQMSDLTVAFSNMALKSNMVEGSGGGSGSTSVVSPVASQLAPGRQLFPLPTTTSSNAPITSITTTAWSGSYLSGPVTSTCHSSLPNYLPSASAYLYAGQNLGHSMSAGLQQSSAVSSTVAPTVSSAGLQGLPPPSWRKGIVDFSIPSGVPSANLLTAPQASAGLQPVQPDVPTWLHQSADLLGGSVPSSPLHHVSPVTVLVDAAGIK